MRFLPAILILAAAASGAAAQSESKQKIKTLREAAKQGSAALAAVAPYMQDADVEVRREAAKALVDIGTQRSIEPLLAAARDNDPEVQIRATDGLVNFYLPGYVKRGLSASLRRAGSALTSRWSDPANDDIVEVDTPIRPEIVETLTTLVASASSMDARANAARALGILRAKGGVAALCDVLRSKDSLLMFESLVALTKIADRSAGPRGAFLVRDLDEKVQLAAIEMVGILTAADAVEPLQRLLEEPRSKKVRRAGYLALARIAKPQSRQAFLGLLADSDDEVRASAAEGLGRIGVAEDRQKLEAAWTAEKKSSPRLALAFALARLGNTDATAFGPMGFLVNSLNQRAWRNVALPYLRELALSEQALLAMLGALKSASTADEKTGLAQALAGSRTQAAIGPLEALSKDEDPAVAREALRALRILKR